MFRISLKKIWSWRHQFVKYCLVGISGLVLDFGLLWLLKERGHLRAVYAVVFSQIVVLSYNFSLNKLWAFGSNGLSRKQFIRYFSVATWNYFFAVVIMWIFNEKFGFHYLVVRLASIMLMVSWNFLLYRFWIFTNQRVPMPIDV